VLNVIVDVLNCYISISFDAKLFEYASFFLSVGWNSILLTSPSIPMLGVPQSSFPAG